MSAGERMGAGKEGTWLGVIWMQSGVQKQPLLLFYGALLLWSSVRHKEQVVLASISNLLEKGWIFC